MEAVLAKTPEWAQAARLGGSMVKRTPLRHPSRPRRVLAGLVLTGRLRSACRERAPPGPARPPGRPARRRRAPAARPAGLAARFQRRRQPAVAGIVNIAAVTVVQRPNSPFGNDPFFQQFFGEQRRLVRIPARAVVRASARASSSPPTATSSRTTTWSAATSARSPVLPDKREVRAKLVGPRSEDRHRRAQDRRAEPAGLPVGRLVDSCRSASGSSPSATRSG